MNSTLYHISVPYSLLHGNYDGQTKAFELKKIGDFGLGTIHGLDGEMIMLDGIIYSAKDDGKTHIVEDSTGIPMAVVTCFNKNKAVEIENKTNFEEIIDIINKNIPTNNIFFAIKISGYFTDVKLRTISKQNKPYKPAIELLEQMEYFGHQNIEGFLIGFKSPPFSKGIGVPGFHFHFIDKDKKVGGHLLDFKLEKGLIEIDYKHDFHVKLDSSQEFYDLDLTKSMDEILNRVENT